MSGRTYDWASITVKIGDKIAPGTIKSIDLSEPPRFRMPRLDEPPRSIALSRGTFANDRGAGAKALSLADVMAAVARVKAGPP